MILLLVGGWNELERRQDTSHIWGIKSIAELTGIVPNRATATYDMAAGHRRLLECRKLSHHSSTRDTCALKQAPADYSLLLGLPHGPQGAPHAASGSNYAHCRTAKLPVNREAPNWIIKINTHINLFFDN